MLLIRLPQRAVSRVDDRRSCVISACLKDDAIVGHMVVLKAELELTNSVVTHSLFNNLLGVH